jgi:hypothetical protein
MTLSPLLAPLQRPGRIDSLGVSTVSYCLFMKCKETRYSHSLSPDLSFDTHVDALLPFLKVFSKFKLTIVYVYKI